MPYSDDFRKTYSEKLSENAEFCTVRTDDNELIGVLAFYCNRPPEAYISHACIDSSHRGKQLIHKMLINLQDYLVSKQFHSLKVEVLNDNKPAIRAYENFGFSFVEFNKPKSLMKKDF